ncbi:MAG: glycoside hydrolase family 43 protein [Kiritimatiellaeota bacterium]|nr:glycoside hydrolase family 43 protein [Kiritimatiellota bacterium]
MMKTADIQIRDPFILPEPQERFYYLFGTTDKNCWKGAGEGFDCFRSKDLCAWEGPMPAFRPPPSFWGTENFWAPEVYRFHDRYYMFASFKAKRCYRGTQILSSTRATGPYVPLTDGPITPADWECLDGTLHVDSDGSPWIIFCHEWVQVHNGAMYAMRLSPDLKKPAGRPVFLFNASEAPWVFRPKWPEKQGEFRFPTYVTDGPFLFRNRNGILLMLWSSSGSKGYAMGIARSESGVVTGPWRQDAVPLWAKDGGHGMIFRGFDGRLFVTFHMPNKTPKERPVFIEIEDTDIGIRLKAESPNKQYAGKGK